MHSKFLFVINFFAAVFITTTFLECYEEKPDKIFAADELLSQNNDINKKYNFVFRERTFVGYPNVYSPVIFPGAKKQSDIPLHKGDHFLELGCGTGIFSV
jgi:hypothetical protein